MKKRLAFLLAVTLIVSIFNVGLAEQEVFEFGTLCVTLPEGIQRGEEEGNYVTAEGVYVMQLQGIALPPSVMPRNEQQAVKLLQEAAAGFAVDAGYTIETLAPDVYSATFSYQYPNMDLHLEMLIILHRGTVLYAGAFGEDAQALLSYMKEHTEVTGKTVTITYEETVTPVSGGYRLDTVPAIVKAPKEDWLALYHGANITTLDSIYYSVTEEEIPYHLGKDDLILISREAGYEDFRISIEVDEDEYAGQSEAEAKFRMIALSISLSGEYEEKEIGGTMYIISSTDSYGAYEVCYRAAMNGHSLQVEISSSTPITNKQRQITEELIAGIAYDDGTQAMDGFIADDVILIGYGDTVETAEYMLIAPEKQYTAQAAYRYATQQVEPVQVKIRLKEDGKEVSVNNVSLMTTGDGCAFGHQIMMEEDGRSTVAFWTVPGIYSLQIVTAEGGFAFASVYISQSGEVVADYDSAEVIVF